MNSCLENSGFISQIFIAVIFRKTYFYIEAITCFFTDNLIFKTWDKLIGAQFQLKTFCCSTFKWLAINLAKEINFYTITIFCFGGFSFWFKFFSRLSKALNRLVNFCIRNLCNFAIKRYIFKISQRDWRDDVVNHVENKIGITVDDIFNISFEINLRLQSRTLITVTQRLLALIIDNLLKNFTHQPRAINFFQMRHGNLTFAETLELNLIFHLKYFGIQPRCKSFF